MHENFSGNSQEKGKQKKTNSRKGPYEDETSEKKNCGMTFS